MNDRGVLAIDQGTTGSRAIVLGHDGRMIGSTYTEFTQHFPEPGWVEHDATEIWDSVEGTVRSALASAEMASFERIAAVGVTNQRETTVLWDRDSGLPVHHAIVWQDRRTSARCAELKGTSAETLVRERTGLVLDPYFSATKIEWLLERSPEWRARAEDGQLLFGTIDSWLVYRLTGGRVHATDHTNASRTLLYSLTDRAWDSDLCDLFGVPMAMLPDVRRSGGDFGVTDPALFGAEVPIAGVAGDQQAALYGQGAWEAGTAKNTYGTGAFALLHTGQRRANPPEGILATMACRADGGAAYALEGSVLVAGAAIQWLRDGLGLITDATESEALARSVEGTAGATFVPAFTGLGTPHWIADARGTMVGLTRGTTRAHIVRATLEAIAHASVDVVEAMTAAAGGGLAALRADGGAARNDWLMQFQADVLHAPVHRPETTELTAIGAAGLAGVTVGFWSSPEDFLPAHGDLQTFEPRGGEALAYAEESRERWRRAVDTAVYWARAGADDGP